MKSNLHKILGYTKYTVYSSRATYYCEKLMREYFGAVFDTEVFEDENCYIFNCYTYLNKKITNSESMKNAKHYSAIHCGLPELILKNKRRIGLLLGAVLCLITINIQKLFLWDINITGNTNVSCDEILETLRSAGFSIGTFIDEEKIPSICNKCVILNKNIAWISINMSGTMAFVEVSERIPRQITNTANMSGIVADSDGVVELVNVSEGTALVNIGETVTKGQMLISPVETGREDNEYITGAYGEILARTYEKFYIFISDTQSLKNEITDIKHSGKLSFLKMNFRNANLFFDRNSNYYIVNTKGRVKIFNVVQLPIYFENSKFCQYSDKINLLDSDMLKKYAYSTLYKSISEEIKTGEILSINTTEKIIDGGIVLECQVECIKNIAKCL